ncbi:hypothetical protein [Allosaccharopolyspora coralli]|uniref:hypothetical protein n=1 Tax=Allosaccharopolyspora coralli TaxID=2665642 RepID=UPI0016521F98|nr:hypothetical protein [Allosaccharopolyspora coralli]
MDYVVTAGLEPPVEATDLDGLQQEGVVALLDRQLSQVEGVANDGDDIDVLDYRITARERGTTVVLALDAPSLNSAEQGAATVLDELLGETELLVGWTVSRSEVRITEDEFNQSFSGRDSDDVEEAALHAAIEEALGGDTEHGSEEPALDTTLWRERLVALAPQLAAFSSEVFSDPSGEVAHEDRLVAAGAVVHAVRVVTDELFYDELALSVNNATVKDAVGLLVLEELPPCYEERYDALFTRALLLSSASVAQRLANRGWHPPSTVAEALALRLVVNEARVLLEAAELMDWERSGRVFTTFDAAARTGVPHEDLFEVDVVFPPSDDTLTEPMRQAQEALRSRGLAFEQWFEPWPGSSEQGPDDTTGLHPYLRAVSS